MKTALASWPRSGNTWLRHLIESATGQKSGSVYRHGSGIMEDGTREGIVVKTHELEREQFDRAIHLVRNPFDAIWSFYHWRRDVNRETECDWFAHVQESVNGWRNWPDHTGHWLEATDFQVRYEDLWMDTRGELARVLAWLGFEPAPDDLERAIQASTLEAMRRRWPSRAGQKFFRRGAIGEGSAHFVQPERKLVLERCGALMKELGYAV